MKRKSIRKRKKGERKQRENKRHDKERQKKEKKYKAGERDKRERKGIKGNFKEFTKDKLMILFQKLYFLSLKENNVTDIFLKNH